MLRLGVRESEELSDGFPQSAEELFAYQAVILDDLEPEFFTQDQLLLLRQFVAVRGGGLMILGGQESFGGEANQSPLGEFSPVYSPRGGAGAIASPGPVRIALTREGMLQPWQRLRSTEQAETTRLAAMPDFRVVNELDKIKPGASTLVTVADGSRPPRPAVVTQRFGRGRTAAVAIGDLWRWSLRPGSASGDESTDDAAAAWRQATRWLVGEVPRRVELTLVPDPSGESVDIRVDVRDTTYLPMDNADVRLTIARVGDGGGTIELMARPDAAELGVYVATFSSRRPGSFVIEARVLDTDRNMIGEDRAGWVAAAGQAEYERLGVNDAVLVELAERTGGRIVDPAQLDQFVDELSTRKVPVTETWTYPLWHQGWVMMLAIACLLGEWSLRRLWGLA